MKYQIILFIILILSTGYAKAQSGDLKMERERLIEADKAWSLAANSNDMEKLWTFWTDDAKILLAVNQTIEGINEIKKFTTQSRTDPNFEISWEVMGAEVSETADMGFTYGIGKVMRTDSNGEIISMTKPYLVVWKKDSEGQWKCLIEN